MFRWQRQSQRGWLEDGSINSTERRSLWGSDSPQMFAGHFYWASIHSCVKRPGLSSGHWDWFEWLPQQSCTVVHINVFCGTRCPGLGWWLNYVTFVYLINNLDWFWTETCPEQSQLLPALPAKIRTLNSISSIKMWILFGEGTGGFRSASMGLLFTAPRPTQ